jgi:hypothetical protein
MQVNPQTPPLQVAAAFAGVGHGVQREPQELTSVLLTHAPSQRWEPELQVNPQETPLHVAVALAGRGHMAQDAPQWLASSFLRQTPPQSW